MSKRGPKPYEPVEEDRRLVETMSSYGIPEEAIARLIKNPKTNAPITAKTMRKYYREELDDGMTKANSQVAQSLFRKCVGAPAAFETMDNGTTVQTRAEIKPDTVACIFWTKARMGWRDSSNIEMSGRNGGPIPLLLTKQEADF